MTSKAAKQIEKIIADGKAKKDSGKQGENLPEGDGGAQDNGRENKAQKSSYKEISLTAIYQLWIARNPKAQKKNIPVVGLQ